MTQAGGVTPALDLGLPFLPLLLHHDLMHLKCHDFLPQLLGKGGDWENARFCDEIDSQPMKRKV